VRVVALIIDKALIGVAGNERVTAESSEKWVILVLLQVDEEDGICHRGYWFSVVTPNSIQAGQIEEHTPRLVVMLRAADRGDM
jgi:hypothetical protein